MGTSLSFFVGRALHAVVICRPASVCALRTNSAYAVATVSVPWIAIQAE